MNHEIYNILNDNENVIYELKPKKSAYCLNKIMRLLPVALIWLAFDGFFLFIVFSAGAEIPKEMIIFLFIFFAFHLMPVWFCLSDVITSIARWKNEIYLITDKRIIIQHGLIGIDYISLFYTDIESVNINIGLIDRIFGVGDIYFTTSSNDYLYEARNHSINNAAFWDISDPYKIYKKIQRVVIDIQTDIKYPNAYRPNNNPGYNTKYR